MVMKENHLLQVILYTVSLFSIFRYMQVVLEHILHPYS